MASGLILLLCCLSLEVHAEGGTAADCRRMKEICQEATQNSDHRKALQTANALKELAGRGADKYYLAYALYYQGISNVILGHSATGKAQLDQAARLADEMDNDTLRLSIHNGYGVYEANVHVNYAQAQQHFYKSLDYAIKIGDPFRQALVECNLAEIAYIKADTTGLKYALNCYDWAVANHNAYLSFAGAYHCACLYHLKGDNPMALKYVKVADAIATRENYADRAAVYKLYGTIYTDTGHYGEAIASLRKALEWSGKAQGATLPEIYCCYARVLTELGRPGESDKMIARGLAVSDSLSIASFVAPLYELKARNSEQRGDFQNALEVYKMYKQSCDSVYADRQQQSINELRVQYDITKREHEADMHRLLLENERRKSALLFISLFSVIVILCILYAYYCRQKRLYKKIVLQNREALTREHDLLHRIEEMRRQAEATAKAPASPIREEKTTSVFDNLCRLMEEDRVYTDSSLTRDRLAEMLGTNRTYLTQIISDRTGKGYYQFINGYRIQAAIRFLSDPANANYPLKALAADLGFSSMSTFYKTFQAAVGMPPSMYRDAARDL